MAKLHLDTDFSWEIIKELGFTSNINELEKNEIAWGERFEKKIGEVLVIIDSTMDVHVEIDLIKVYFQYNPKIETIKDLKRLLSLLESHTNLKSLPTILKQTFVPKYESY